MIGNKIIYSYIIALLAQFVSANICESQPNDEDLLPHEDCAKFYQCSNGEIIEHHCSGNLLYNPEKQVCDWPENVECNEAATRDAPDAFSVNPQEYCAGEGTHGDLLPHENCNQFYECSFGHAFEFSCPDGLLFSEETERCEWGPSVACGERVPPPQN